LPDGKDYEQIFGDFAITIPPTGARYGHPLAVQPWVGDVVYVSQETYSLNLWNSFRSIVFTSNLLPIKREFVPKVSGREQFGQIADDSLGVLTDFEPLTSTSAETNRGLVQYFPQGEYRMVTLLGTRGIQTVDVQAFWADTAGTLRPILIDALGSMSVKIMFRKKRIGI
jgi:hypothetical protein